ncbi:MAG: hypothetical protein RL218_233, partial [Actinomycetota bacterium]
REEALVEIYKRARPGEPPNVESARAYFEGAFFESRRYDLSRVGRYKLNRKLGAEIEKIGQLFGLKNGTELGQLDVPTEGQDVLSRCEVLATITYLLHLVKQEPGYRLDDQDHFANRRIRSVGELIQNQVRIGLSRMERVVRERMTTQDVEAISPQTLINVRPVVAAIKEFFGTSQLSQFMDQGTRSTRCRVSRTVAVSRRSDRVDSAASAPDSKFATCTSRTTAVCARSRRRKVRTSV